jgi:fumarate reductase subunit D
MRSPLALIGAIVAAVILALIGLLYQLGAFGPRAHGISHHALLFWGLAVVALVVASFARPQNQG